MGVKVIVGDVVLDHSAFQVSSHDAAAFDNEPFRPYNAGPDALLINYKTQVLGFIPDPAAGVARIHYELPMAGVQAPAQRAPGPGRHGLRRLAHPVAGRLERPAAHRSCWAATRPAVATRTGPWPWPAPSALPRGPWRACGAALGGQITGRVRDGQVPPGLKPAWDSVSPALGEVVRDINKFSNNVMTQQLLLTLGKERMGVGSFDAGRTALSQWWQLRWAAAEMPVVDNGAGLSSDARISAQALGRMLQAAWHRR